MIIEPLVDGGMVFLTISPSCALETVLEASMRSGRGRILHPRLATVEPPAGEIIGHYFDNGR